MHGGVPTRSSFVEIFSDSFIAHFPPGAPVKTAFQIRSTVSKDIDKRLIACFSSRSVVVTGGVRLVS